jgi:hypothetical protein
MLLPLVAVATVLAGCAETDRANPLTFGKVDSNSSVAADVAAAQGSPGPYPSFSHIPPTPKDVRPALAWRESVAETWALKRRTETDAAAVPFGLTSGEAQGWADTERAKIPAEEMTPPPADAAADTQAFADTARARATPPPPQK